MIEHEPYLGLLAGRELGGLDDAEAFELDRHLAGCLACAAEARAIGETTAALAFIAPDRRPPESLRSSILASVRAAPPARLSLVPPARPSWRERFGWFGPGHLAAGLAFVLVIVSLGAWRGTASLRADLDQQRAVAASAIDQLGLASAAMSVALDPDHVSAPLVPEALAPNALAQVVFRPGTTESYLVADRLPATPTGKVYQLWYADGTGVHPLGTVAFDGQGALVAPFGVDLAGKAAAMVTLESVGGAAGEPGPQVVFGDLPKP